MAKSSAKKHSITHPTLDWDHSTGELKTTADAKQYNLPYADAKPKGKQYGMRITVEAFHQLLKGALKAQTNQKAPTVRYVEFSKASIFRVLSQPGCEYIRFYFVYPEKNKMSLVLEGLDENRQALKLQSHVMKMAAGAKARAAEEDDPVYEERGNNDETGGDDGDATPGALSASAGKTKKNTGTNGQATLKALLNAINAKGAE